MLTIGLTGGIATGNQQLALCCVKQVFQLLTQI